MELKSCWSIAWNELCQPLLSAGIRSARCNCSLRMSWQIQEGVNLGHTDSLWTVSNFYNVIACTNFSLLQHAKVESWSVMFYEQGCHPRFIHADADAIARHAWLRYFKFSTTDAVSIADAHLVIRKSLRR